MGDAVDALAVAALDFIERTKSSTDCDALFSDFKKTLLLFGITRFMMTRLPAVNANLAPLIIKHTWSPEWLHRYLDQNYFLDDPVAQHFFAQSQPFTWSQAFRAARRTRRSLQIMSEARGMGLVDGIAFPILDPGSTQSICSLAADQGIDLTSCHKALLHLMCIYCAMKAVEEEMTEQRRPFTLSPAEREVLQWMANGKTMAETAIILRKSDRTVEAHLSHARAKLQASNTTEAVAKALSQRKITL